MLVTRYLDTSQVFRKQHRLLEIAIVKLVAEIAPYRKNIDELNQGKYAEDFSGGPGDGPRAGIDAGGRRSTWVRRQGHAEYDHGAQE